MIISDIIKYTANETAQNCNSVIPSVWLSHNANTILIEYDDMQVRTFFIDIHIPFH